MIKKSSTFLLFAATMMAWAVVGIPLAAQAGPGGHPDLTGQWQLNRSQSDDPQAKFGSMGSGGGHHGGGGGPLEEIRRAMMNAPARLVMAHDDQKVVLTEPDGHVRTLPTNNRQVKIDGREVRTTWEGNRLISETAMGGTKLVETYERSPDGKHLVVTVGTEMHGQQMSIRRVYARASQ